MTRDVRTCRPETSLNDAASEMWRGDCGILPVVDGDRRVVGLITDRDVCMGAYLQGKPLSELPVRDSMSRAVFACRPSDSIEDVVRCMADHQVRRVPVTGARGELLGILSLNDLARHLVSLGERERARLVPRFVEAQASICEPRAQTALPEPIPAARVARPAAMPVG
jgi:CBS domain-containing protein